MSKLYLTIQILCILIAVSFSADYLTEKPDWVKSCKSKEPNFTECTTKSIQGILNKMAQGIPEFKNFPAVDPYKIKKIKIDQGGEGPINLKITLSDMLVTGFLGAIVNESRFNSEKHTWKSKMFMPSLKLDGHYAVQGRVLLIPLNSEGKLKLDIENLDFKILTKTIRYEIDDLIFNNVTNVAIDYTMQGLKVKMDNLFNGNKELEDSTNALFNENWPALAETMKPIIKESVEGIMFDVFNRLFSHLPVKYFIEDLEK